jgi:hypothetical protein
VPALESLVAAAAAADMDVELAMNGASRDLDLVLVRDVGFLDWPAAAGANRGEGCLVDFVEMGRWLPMGLGAIVRAGLATGPLRLGLRRSLGEGGGLALVVAPRLLQLAGQAFDLGFELGNTVPQVSDESVARGSRCRQGPPYLHYRQGGRPELGVRPRSILAEDAGR